VIQLNGYKERWFAGAGALGLDGFDAGHPPLVRAYKWPFRAAGLLDPHAFTVITKTVTAEPRIGRQTDWGFRKYAWPIMPLWRRSMVNAVALTNPGFDVWERVHYRHAMRKGIKLVLSLHLDNAKEAFNLGERCRHLKGLAAIQVNAGCPNLDPAHAGDPDAEVKGFRHIIEAFQDGYTGPLLIKFRLGQPWEQMAESLEGRCAGYELVNACPWDFAKEQCLSPAEVPRGMVEGDSPLAKYGVGGSVSGGRLNYCATIALNKYMHTGGATPVMSGGGVVGYRDPYGYPTRWRSLPRVVHERFVTGAAAIVFSTAFLWDPAGPNRVVKEFDRRFAEDANFTDTLRHVHGHYDHLRRLKRGTQAQLGAELADEAVCCGGGGSGFDGDFPTTDYGAGSLA
jgi:hypothetical protein